MEDIANTANSLFKDEDEAKEALKFNFKPTTSTDEELNIAGRTQAAGVASDKGNVAAQQASAATRKAGGSKLFAALQGAQAATQAASQGFSDEANTARAEKMQREREANELAFNKASQEYQTEAQKRAAETQREHDKAMAEAQRKHEKAMEKKRMEFEKSEREKDREETRADRAHQEQMTGWQLLGGLFSSFI